MLFGKNLSALSAFLAYPSHVSAYFKLLYFDIPFKIIGSLVLDLIFLMALIIQFTDAVLSS